MKSPLLPISRHSKFFSAKPPITIKRDITMKLTRGLLFPAVLVSLLGVLITGHYTQAVAQLGDWDGSVLDYKSNQIYYAPVEPGGPGYSCWVGLWQLPDGTIQTDFTTWTKEDQQYTNAAGEYTSSGYDRTVIETTDKGATWTRVYLPRGLNQLSRGMLILPDTDGSTEVGYTMIRPYWPAGFDIYPDHLEPDWPFSAPAGVGYTVRSIDGGDTWIDQAMLPGYPELYRRVLPSSTIREVTLGDGTKAILLMGGIDPPGELPPGYHIAALMTKQIWLSTDQGRSWGEPIELMALEEGFTEESDFVQIPNGDLLWVHRVGHFDSNGKYTHSDRMQSYCKRVGNTFVPQPATLLPWLHSGFPNLIKTKEGIIIHFATNGSHWTADYGQSWHPLKVGASNLTVAYYPMSLQLDNGTIMVIGHVGSDAGPYAQNQSIRQQTFRLLDGLTTFFEEDFEGGAEGTAVNGYNGWTGSDGIAISGTAIDAGKSAKWNTATCAHVTRSFTSKVLAEFESYVLTATLKASGPNDYASITIRDKNQSWNTSMMVLSHNGSLYFMRQNQELWCKITDPNPSVATDIKLVLIEGQVDYYYRKNGDSDWISAGTKNGLSSLYVPEYDEIELGASGSGGIDSILFNYDVQEQEFPPPVSYGFLLYIR